MTEHLLIDLKQVVEWVEFAVQMLEIMVLDIHFAV